MFVDLNAAVVDFSEVLSVEKMYDSSTETSGWFWNRKSIETKEWSLEIVFDQKSTYPYHTFTALYDTREEMEAAYQIAANALVNTEEPAV